MTDTTPIQVEVFYHYGYRGRDMIAIISPFAMSADAAQIIGHDVRVDAKVYRVTAVARQISGPIQKGEPMGIEIQEVASADSDNCQRPHR